MNKFIKYLFFLNILITTVSCNNKQSQEVINKDDAIRYAKGFSVDSTDKNYKKLTVYNPWNDYKTHSTYYLVKDMTVETPTDGIKIKTPINKVMVNSATYLGFMELLGVLNTVTATCNTDYVYNEVILAGVQEGSIKDVGDSYNLNMEQLILTKPEVVFTTSFSGDQAEADNFTRFKLTPIFNIEWQEPSILGRAEWIKFIAAFYDKDEEADCIFNTIVTNYEEAELLASNVSECPTILSGQDFRGTWSMPAGQSYNAELFKAAKTDYYYKEDTKNHGSIPVTIEEALIYFNSAKVWVNVQANTLSELIESNDKYRLFEAYKTKNVYNNNNRSNSRGGNDYWEMGVARPDLILKDLIKAAHPELMTEYEFSFLKKLD